VARKRSFPSSEYKILVVDDQQETLESVAILLAREGHTVLTADNGHRALEILESEPVHLMLVDYFMPKMTGEELIREVRKFDPYVQIILQTGYSGEKPPRVMLADLDIQGYHDKADGPERLLLWVDVGLKAYRMIHELRERERVQRELVANVSHEFRTPLNVIGGYADLLLEHRYGDIPAGARQPLQRVQSAAMNLADLLENLLKYAKIEAGAEVVHAATISTTSLTDEIERWVMLLGEGTATKFEVDAKVAPASVVSDRVKVLNILRNLIGNALKFTEFGRVVLRIEDGEGGVRFHVSDTGPGISPEHLRVIFEPFRQVDGSSTRRHGGVGLGLALSSKLAKLLGGRIDVESRVGAGATFTLVIPNAAPPQASVPAAYEPAVAVA